MWCEVSDLSISSVLHYQRFITLKAKHLLAVVALF